MNRYAMSIIEMPLEIYPDGSYKQLPDRAQVRFELLTRLPEIHELPKTVPLNEVLASAPKEQEKEIRIRTSIGTSIGTSIPTAQPTIEANPDEIVVDAEDTKEPLEEEEEEEEEERGFISLAEIQSAAPKLPSHSKTFKNLASFGSRFSRKASI